MKIFKISALLLCAAFSLFSCKKDDDESVKDLLTKGTWISTDYRSDDNNDGELTADESDFEDCEKDDTTTFSSNGSYSYTDGTDICDPDFPNEGAGNWVLASDDKTLTITEDGFGLAFEIVSISSTELVLRNETFGLVEATYKH